MTMHKTRMILAGGLLASMALSPVQADDHGGTYAFDREGQHQFIQFRTGHLGFSYLYGRFNDFDGEFTFDGENPENSSVNVTIQTASVDSNHGERDRHLRSDDFLHVEEYPQATFRSTAVTVHSEDHATVTGDLTLRGVTREVALDMEMIGYGEDPWGGERMGFAGTTTLTLDDFGFPTDLGPSSEEVELMISIEGIRQ